MIKYLSRTKMGEEVPPHSAIFQANFFPQIGGRRGGEYCPHQKKSPNQYFVAFLIINLFFILFFGVQIIIHVFMLNSKVISFDALICNIIGSAVSGFLLYYRLTNTISEPYDAHTEKDTTTRDAEIFKLSLYNIKGFSLNFQICF